MSLWSWLFPPRKIEPVSGDLTTAFIQTEQLLRERRPDLADEFSGLRGSSFAKTKAFLDAHFPIEDGGWGDRLIGKMPDDVRAWLDEHEVTT